MTLLEPEMLMMAVQSGIPPASCRSHLLCASLKSLGVFVLGMDRDRKIKNKLSRNCTAFSGVYCSKKTFSLIPRASY